MPLFPPETASEKAIREKIERGEIKLVPTPKDIRLNLAPLRGEHK